MTAITKKPVNPTAHLTPEDIEQLGLELDTIRQDVLDTRGEEGTKALSRAAREARAHASRRTSAHSA